MKRDFFYDDMFTKNEQQIGRDNLSFYQLYNGIMAGFMVVLFVGSWFTDYFTGLRWIYVTVGGVSGVEILLLKSYLKNTLSTAKLAVCVGYMKTYLFCLMTSVVLNTQQPAITFHIFLLLLSVTFVLRPLVMILTQTTAVVLFCILSYTMKPWAIAQGDILSAVIFLVIGMFLAYKTATDRIVKVDTAARMAVTQEELEQECRKYDALMSSIPGGVGIFELGLSVCPLYVNDRVNQIFGIDKEGDNCSITDLLEVIHPDDVERMRMDGTMAALRKSNIAGIYRTRPVKGNYRWIHVLGSWVRDNEAGIPVYSVVIVDVDKEKRQEERELQELLTNSLAYYKLNLTRNEVTEQKSSTHEAGYLFEADSIDQLADRMKERVVGDSFRQELSELLNQELLTEAYDNGRTSCSMDYMYQPNEEAVCWLRLNINISENRQTMELEAFASVSDINEEKITALLVDNISRQNYDFVMTIDLCKKKYRMHACAENNQVALPPVDGDYTILWKLYCNTYIVEEQRERLQEELELARIVERLQTQDSLVLYADMHTASKQLCSKKLQYSYISRDMGVLLLTIADITDIVEKEESDRVQLEQQLAQIKEEVQDKELLITHMTDEMQLPLVGIRDMLEELKSSEQLRDGESDPRLDRAKLYATHLNSIMNDMCEILEQDRRPLELQEKVTNRDEFWNRLLGIIQPLADDLHVKLVCDLGSSFYEKSYVDEPRLRQILVNTLIGALHNAKEGGTVTLISRYAKLSVDYMRVKYLVTNENGRTPVRPGETVTRSFVQMMNGYYEVDDSDGSSMVTIELEMEGVIG